MPREGKFENMLKNSFGHFLMFLMAYLGDNPWNRSRNERRVFSNARKLRRTIVWACFGRFLLTVRNRFSMFRAFFDGVKS